MAVYTDSGDIWSYPWMGLFNRLGYSDYSCNYGHLFTTLRKTKWFLRGIKSSLKVNYTLNLSYALSWISFQVFYWTHLLYIPFWILLIIHTPHFWIWFAAPGLIFVFEKIYRKYCQLTGYGTTYIKSAVVFPSRVTQLVIKKPNNFHYHPGDYVFVKIKSIASYEWHPFTISSAPELPGKIVN